MFSRDFAPLESQGFIADFLDQLAGACSSAGAEVIGHIKLLATTPEGGYFRGSVTSTHIPADVEGIDVGVHRSLDIHLIMLVYGLEKEELERTLLIVWTKLIETGFITSVEHLLPTAFHKKEIADD